MTKPEAELNLVYVNTAKQKIACLLNLKPSTLHLLRIDEGTEVFTVTSTKVNVCVCFGEEGGGGVRERWLECRCGE